MTAMTVTHYGQDSYDLYKAFDPDAGPEGTEYLLRVYSDGTTTVSTRPGEYATDRTWSPEVVLHREQAEPDCCGTHDGPHVHGCVMPRRAGRTHLGPCRKRVSL